MADYKVLKVSQDEPRRWDGPHGAVFYIKVMLEGHSKAVSIGKKKPDALKVGDTVSGDILPDSGSEDKFKAAPPSSGFGGSTSSGNSYIDHHEDIKAEWAIGQAIASYAGTIKTIDYDDIKHRAVNLYNMVDAIKAGKPEPTPAPDVATTDEFGEEPPFDMNDIPF